MEKLFVRGDFAPKKEFVTVKEILPYQI